MYEVAAPPKGFKLPDDTADRLFAPLGKAPGPWGKSHADDFARPKP